MLCQCYSAFNLWARRAQQDLLQGIRPRCRAALRNIGVAVLRKEQADIHHQPPELFEGRFQLRLRLPRPDVGPASNQSEPQNTRDTRPQECSLSI